MLTNIFDPHNYTDMTITKELTLTKELTITKFEDATKSDSNDMSSMLKEGNPTNITIALYKEFAPKTPACHMVYIGKCEITRPFPDADIPESNILIFSTADASVGHRLELRVIEDTDSMKALIKNTDCNSIDKKKYKYCIVGTVGKAIHYRQLDIGFNYPVDGNENNPEKTKKSLEKERKELVKEIKTALNNFGILDY